MNTPTAADHGKMTFARCRATRNWVTGKVDVTAKGVVRILVRGIIRPLQAFLEFANFVISGTLTIPGGDRLRATFQVDLNNRCWFTTPQGQQFALGQFSRFVPDPQ